MNLTRTILRRWWVIALAAGLAVTSAAFLTMVREPAQRYEVGAVLFVPPDGETIGANDAVGLARLYTRLVPADDRIVGHVATQSGLSTAEVRSAMTIATVRDSSLLEVGFAADDPDVARAGLDAMLAAVVDGDGGQATIPTDLLQELSRDLDAQGTGDGTWIILMAIVGGLVLAVGGVIALERSDVRVDAVEVVSERTGVPGSDLGGMPDHSVAVLLGHFEELCTTRPARIALLGATPGSQERAASVADHLLAAAPGLDVDLVTGGAPGTVEGGEWIAADGEVVVLVVPRGARLTQVERAAASLRQLDLGPTWLLVADRTAGGGATLGGDERGPGDEHGTGDQGRDRPSVEA